MKESREMLTKELMEGLNISKEIAEEYAKYLVNTAKEEYEKLFKNN